MHIVHLTASTFFGGPERQMLGLAGHLGEPFRSSFVSFREGGRCEEFLSKVREAGFPALALERDTPNVPQALAELAGHLSSIRADVLLCHTFKPNVLGRLAARRLGLPCVVVSRGWTGENWKVSAYETVDRVNLRFVDRVVAVSDGQAAKVRRAGVPSSRLSVIRNAARLKAFAEPMAEGRIELRSAFASDTRLSHVVVAAGRLSPEKGYDVLLEAMPALLRQHPQAGLVLYGEGAERPRLEARAAELGVADRFRMPGFTANLDRLLPWCDLFVLPSRTEGLPNVALEASAAGVAIVATAVGGTPEVVADGENGLLVPSDNHVSLAEAMGRVLADGEFRSRLGSAGRERMVRHFTFEAQALQYANLFRSLAARSSRKAR